MVDQGVYMGRQPILNNKQVLVGYELLFRSADSLHAAKFSDVNEASAQVMINTLCDFGLREVVGEQKGFMNVSTHLLMSGAIELLPKEHIVIELLETISVNSAIVNRCRELKSMGFTLALDDFVYSPEYDGLLDIVDIIKVDVMETPVDEVSKVVKHLRNWQLKLLAEKVEDPEQFELCRNLGFEMYQGFFFAKPQLLSRKRVDLSKVTLLRLLEQVMSDASADVIEETFKQSPELSYNLLRLVNSVGVGMLQKIQTLQHAVVVLGREKLKRWVQLLLFTHGAAKPSKNPLMHMAVFRGRLMELLAGDLSAFKEEKIAGDFAFMAGILSLLDTLIGMPMEELLDQINLDDIVREALIDREGSLGKLLKLVESWEATDFNQLEKLLDEFSLTKEEFMAAELKAMSWVNSILSSLS